MVSLTPLSNQLDPCPAHARSHPQMIVPSLLNVSELLSPGQRSWLPSDEPCIFGEVVWFLPFVQMGTLLTALDRMNNIAKFVSGTLVLRVN